MKYVVSGYIGFDNFGDEAIAMILTQKLKQKGAEKITLISSNPAKTSKMYGVDSCEMLKFFTPIKNADVLISGGGSLLQDKTSLKSLVYYLVVIYTALLLRKKVEIYAQGIGPINSAIGKILTKFALKKADKISVRDSKSQKLLNDWGIKSELVNDPILELDLPKSECNNSVGIQLRDFPEINNQFLEKLACEIVKHFKDKKIIIISLQDSIDLNICNNFAEILKKNGLKDISIAYNLDINSAIKTLSNLEYLIAMRFHANVIGIKSGIKTLAINYDPKVEKLAQTYNLPIIGLRQDNIESEFEKLFR